MIIMVIKEIRAKWKRLKEIFDYLSMCGYYRCVTCVVEFVRCKQCLILDLLTPGAV